jgi:hypothetical protein
MNARELLDAYADEACTHLAVSGANFEREGFAPKTFDALGAVLDLHSSDNGMSAFCNGCDFPFPCPTVKAISTALEAPPLSGGPE